MSASEDQSQAEEPGESGRHGLPELIAERRAKAERLRRSDESRSRTRSPAPSRSRRSRRDTSAFGPARRPTSATASPAGSPPAAAPARWRSSISSTAPAGSSCTRAWTCSARRRWPLLLSLDLGDLIGVDGARDPHPPRRAVAAGGRASRCSPRRCARRPTSTTASTDVETRHRHRELDLIAKRGRSATVRRPRARSISADARLPRRARASSRSRRRCCSRSTAARSRARSRPTTTRSTATCTCGSPPSCTSSG